MNIVLNEYDWAKEMVAQNSLGDRPFDTLTRVAKYYMHDGYKGKDLRLLMNSFLAKCDPFVSIPKWDGILNSAIAKAQKYGVVMIDEIVITDAEVEKIKSISGKQLQRLAFTLLCLSKYYDKVNPNADHWVNTPDRDIIRMANINTSIRRQSAMFHTLSELGMIQFSKKVDNTNVRVCFAEDGKPAVHITDMRNLGYQYMMSIGERGYIVCKNCGITVKYDAKKSAGRTPKYCPPCATEMNLQQTIAAVMRSRRSKKVTTL